MDFFADVDRLGILCGGFDSLGVLGKSGPDRSKLPDMNWFSTASSIFQRRALHPRSIGVFDLYTPPRPCEQQTCVSKVKM